MCVEKLEFDTKLCKNISWKDLQHMKNSFNNCPIYASVWLERSWDLVISKQLNKKNGDNKGVCESVLWVTTLVDIYIDYLHILTRIGLNSFDKNDELIETTCALERIRSEVSFDLYTKEKFQIEIDTRRMDFVQMIFRTFNNSSIKVMYFMAGYGKIQSKQYLYELNHITVKGLDDLIQVKDYTQTRKIMPIYLWIKNGMHKLNCKNRGDRHG